MKLSIVTVNYKVEKELFKSLSSIKDKIKGVSFEVIVVENDPQQDLSKKIRQYKFVKYIRSSRNLGFGGGNNLGASKASGEYLFFLNPDTEIAKGSISGLLNEFAKSVGIVAPLLLDKKNKLYPLQGTKRLTPLNAIFSLSFINKFWPNNPVAKKYWLRDINRQMTHEVDVIPGTAFVIKRKLFEKLGGFDEKFFLYFEENDLCNRVKELGFKILMSPALKIIHLWGISTKKEKNINKIFSQSRFYYLSKYYGRLIALLTTFLLEFNFNSLLLLLILLFALILRLWDVDRLMIFIPDQAWFYLSAQDMISTGRIPLVGITSSQVWLHQGPAWTYMLALTQVLTGYNSVNGAYLSILFDLATIITVYLIGSEFFTKRTGLIVSALYAFSPLTIVLSRMPYHTSPIPFFVALTILFTLKWVRGSFRSFPLILFCLAVLYNLELASVVVWFSVLAIFIYGLIKKKDWVINLLNPKVIFVCALAFILPLVPIIIYDLQHELVQTLKYANWVIILKVIKPVVTLEFSQPNPVSMYEFLNQFFQRFLFLPNGSIALLLFLAGTSTFVYQAFKEKIKNENTNVLLILFLIPFGGLIFNGVASDAYLPLLFPTIVMIVAIFLNKLFALSKVAGFLLLSFIVIFNVYTLLNRSYLTGTGEVFNPTIEKLRKEVGLHSKNSPNYKALNYKYINLHENN